MRTKTNPLSVEKIREYARLTRDFCHVDETKPFPILKVLEGLNDDCILNLEICEDSEFAKDIYALYVANTNSIKLRESVYNECYEGMYRSNFTLAHEFFHYIQVKHLNFSFEDVEVCPAYMDVEWQANEFAGQLLIPDIALNLTDPEIMEKYQVSEEAVKTRRLYVKKRKKAQN